MPYLQGFNQIASTIGGMLGEKQRQQEAWRQILERRREMEREGQIQAGLQQLRHEQEIARYPQWAQAQVQAQEPMERLRSQFQSEREKAAREYESPLEATQRLRQVRETELLQPTQPEQPKPLTAQEQLNQMILEKAQRGELGELARLKAALKGEQPKGMVAGITGLTGALGDLWKNITGTRIPATFGAREGAELAMQAAQSTGDYRSALAELVRLAREGKISDIVYAHAAKELTRIFSKVATESERNTGNPFTDAIRE